MAVEKLHIVWPFLCDLHVVVEDLPWHVNFFVKVYNICIAEHMYVLFVCFFCCFFFLNVL